MIGHPLPEFKLGTPTLARYQKIDALDCPAMVPAYNCSSNWSQNWPQAIKSCNPNQYKNDEFWNLKTIIISLMSFLFMMK